MSGLQGRHQIFDHFGLGDCDAAHHEEDQEGVVVGVWPAHLKTKTWPGSESGGPWGASHLIWLRSPTRDPH